MAEVGTTLHQLLERFPKRSIHPRGFVDIGTYTGGNFAIMTWIGNGLDNDTNLQIGKFCSIGGQVTIYLGGEHRGDWVSTYAFPAFIENYGHMKGHRTTKGDVVIGNDVWIGNNVTILSGVNIGDGAIIGANAVIAKDVPPYGVAVGNPQRIVKYRFDESTISALLDIKWWDWEIDEIENALPFILTDDIESFITDICLKRK